jgi:hypothetical protein
MKISQLKALIREEVGKVLTESTPLKGKVGEYEFINWVNTQNTKAGDEIYEIDTTMMDSSDVANEYDSILKKYKIPGDVYEVKLDREGYISWIKIK